MVPHAAQTMNQCQVGEDGRTAHYRLQLKNFDGTTFEFGEQVLSKPKRKIKHVRQRTLDATFREATWVGLWPHGRTRRHTSRREHRNQRQNWQIEATIWTLERRCCQACVRNQLQRPEPPFSSDVVGNLSFGGVGKHGRILVVFRCVGLRCCRVCLW